MIFCKLGFKMADDGALASESYRVVVLVNGYNNNLMLYLLVLPLSYVLHVLLSANACSTTNTTACTTKR